TQPYSNDIIEENILIEHSYSAWKVSGDNSRENRLILLNQSIPPRKDDVVTFGGVFDNATEIIFEDPLNASLQAWENQFSHDSTSEIQSDENEELNYYSKSSHNGYAFIRKSISFHEPLTTYMISFDYKPLASLKDTQIFALFDSAGNPLVYIRFPWGNESSQYLDFVRVIDKSTSIDKAAKIGTSLGNWQSINVIFREVSANLNFEVRVNSSLCLSITTDIRLSDIRSLAIGSLEPGHEARFRQFKIKTIGKRSTEIFAQVDLAEEIDISSTYHLTCMRILLLDYLALFHLILLT
ncbi:MAG: hypothetical protein QW279_15905, partial [Candidatus Jordarchaeaceae archaeon]